MATTIFEKPMGTEIEDLKDDISTLNSKIAKKTYSSSDTGISSVTRAVTFDGMCYLQFYEHTPSSTSEITIGTLPTQFRPSFGVFGCLVSGDGTKSAYLNITTSGAVKIQAPTASIRYYGSIVYPLA